MFLFKILALFTIFMRTTELSQQLKSEKFNLMLKSLHDGSYAQRTAQYCSRNYSIDSAVSHLRGGLNKQQRLHAITVRMAAEKIERQKIQNKWQRRQQRIINAERIGKLRGQPDLCLSTR
jgi:hypothetical protein